MTDHEKLEALHQRMLAEQRRLILSAAEHDMVPSAGTLSRIADLEQAIVAVDEALGEDGGV